MKNIFVISSFIFISLFFVPCLNGEMTGGQEAEATFVVRWYDVGVNALAGRSGVISVERGWLGSSEINTVVYDPGKIELEQIEKHLKRSGTYINTIKGSEQ